MQGFALKALLPQEPVACPKAERYGMKGPHDHGQANSVPVEMNQHFAQIEDDGFGHVYMISMTVVGWCALRPFATTFRKGAPATSALSMASWSGLVQMVQVLGMA